VVPFTDSSDLLEDEHRLRARFADDGYVFLRGVIDRGSLLDVRARLTSILAARHWLAPGTDPMDAVPNITPCVEGEDEYFEAYDEIQRLEVFHAIPHHPTVQRAMTALLGSSAFPHPLSIARLSFPHNDAWSTPPHQDFPNNQGTIDLYACWIPLGDCPVELGGLEVLAGSHRLGVAPLEFSLGAGNRRARLDERHDALSWHGGDFALGDAIVFHSCTVHRAHPNTTDRLRLSVDYRFQREGASLTAGCLEPHFGRLSWDEIYQGWERSDLQYYWRRRRYDVAPWDPTLHALPDEHYDEAVRAWMVWRQEHPRSNRTARAPKARLQNAPRRKGTT
jgi:hypothetical protein